MSRRTVRVAVQWLGLLALGAAIAFLLEQADLPAPALIGAMAAGIAVSLGGGTIQMPRRGFAAAQAMVGCLIATSLSPGIFAVFARHWPIFAAAILATVAVSSLLGWLISRWRILPGTVGVWGAAPGAATAMVLMAEAFGDDQRLVAFMQYLRVIIVSLGAALIAGFWVDLHAAGLPQRIWFPAIEPLALAGAILIALGGAALGRLARLPSPDFLGSFLLGAVLHLAFGVNVQIPAWLAAASFAAIGCSIGLRFQRDTLRRAMRALPQIVLSILMLMAFCAGIAFVLVQQMGVDPLTAYLATSPGGMETVAIVAIAAGSVDMSFVMTMQALRFLFVLLAGPAIARLVARRVRQ